MYKIIANSMLFSVVSVNVLEVLSRVLVSQSYNKWERFQPFAVRPHRLFLASVIVAFHKAVAKSDY